MDIEPGEPGNAEVPATTAPQVEATVRSIWQRVLMEAGGPHLTPAEAAFLLDASVDAVKQRIDAGRVRSFHDDRGRIRITASVSYAPDGEADELADAEWVARLLAELKSVREELEASRAQEARLQEELEAAEVALEYTKVEVANLWRVMTRRNMSQAARRAVHDLAENPRIMSLAEQRERIRTKVNDVRDIARRRRWPWSLVS